KRRAPADCAWTQNTQASKSEPGRGQRATTSLSGPSARSGLYRQIAVYVPGHALRSNFRMLSQKFQRISAGSRIVLLVSESSGFARGLGLHAQAAINDGKDIVRRQVVGVDRLQRLVLGASLGV